MIGVSALRDAPCTVQFNGVQYVLKVRKDEFRPGLPKWIYNVVDESDLRTSIATYVDTIRYNTPLRKVLQLYLLPTIESMRMLLLSYIMRYIVINKPH